MHAEQRQHPFNQWSEDRIKRLKELLDQNLSAQQVAWRLGNVTRNAVIGKAKRMGFALQPPQNPPRPSYVIDRTSAPRKRRAHVTAGRLTQQITPRVPVRPEFPAEPVVIHEDIYVAPENRKGVLALTSADCRWPIGDPREADFHFCGGPRVPGLPYCEGHCKRAYQTVQEVDARRLRAMKAA